MKSVRLSALAFASLLGLAAAASAPGCATEATPAAAPSLEQSGRFAFVCLAEHSVAAPGLNLGKCTARQTVTLYDFYDNEVDPPTPIPHLYGLITQTTRGEIAVVDFTSQTSPVIDANPAIPGANFLQIGAQPVDIVSTPGGTATFVAVAEVGREGIFALPSTRIRPCLTQPGENATAEEKARCGPPVISSWPSCSLPSAPGAMMMLPDPAVNDVVRATCTSDYTGAPAKGTNGDIGLEGNGRQKLIVTMPDLGGIAVFDAQAILDRAPGGGEDAGFEPCEIERWLPLEVGDPPPVDPLPIPSGAACVVPDKLPPVVTQGASPRPAGLGYADGRLYIADLAAPVIHVLDLATPCEPKPRPSLVPTSLEDPKRVVTTTRVAVMPELTPDLRRYLYAVDALDGSTMVFDVSDVGGSRFPLRRPHPEWDPFQPIDRIRFSAPVRDLTMLQRDIRVENPVTGVIPQGTRCDPDPRVICDPLAATCDPAALYRTSADYDPRKGAAPTRLRGTFAVVVLTTGEIIVIDVDDLDARCRIPSTFDSLAGCPPTSFVRDCATDADCASGLRCSAIGHCIAEPCFDGVKNGDEEDKDCGGPACDPCAWAGSGEVSCNVVVPNTPRSRLFFQTNSTTGIGEPGIQAFPSLVDRAGTLISPSNEEAPKLRAPLGSSALGVGSQRVAIRPDGLIDSDDGVKNAIAMTLEDPHAHIADQSWVFVYEGGLLGFSGRYAALDPSGTTLTDPNSRFCDRGVQSLESARLLLAAEGSPSDDAAAQAFSDIVQIVSDIPDEGDTYWSSATCSFQECKSTFGRAATPLLARDLTIKEAYQDHLELGDAGAQVRCCFPSAVAFNVRARGQWVATGSVTGFLHHVIADPATGVCRNSCDPAVGRLNGRLRTAPGDAYASDKPDVKASVSVGGRFTLETPMFRAVVTQGTEPPVRDLLFAFVTEGSFKPLLVNLAERSPSIQPQAIGFVPPLGELAVTNGSLEGLLMVSLGSFKITRQIY